MSRAIKSDIDTGLYIPDTFDYVRPFVTCVETSLELRDGPRKQHFLSCAYEALGHKNKRQFVAMCPTNYLSYTGGSLPDSLSALGEVIQARYEGESMRDLMRELPKTPLVTTFALENVERPKEVCATIVPDVDGFQAYMPGTSLSAGAKDPYAALLGLERVLSDNERVDLHEHVLRDEPIFGSADVHLLLQESISTKRFLISISPCQNGSKFYRAYAPQAGVTTRSPTIDGALHNIKDAIALQFHEHSLADVEKAIAMKPIVTMARLN
ncbi:MAG: hypothetical protein ACM3NG_00245 [Candidatus Doudnabacteria bacterium]